MWAFGRSRSSLDLGRRGEKLARKHLRRAGLKILARNYRCSVGEIDIIALDSSTRRRDGAETVVFVEVKTRSSDQYTDPEAAVDKDKRRRMRKTANYYLTTHDAGGFNARFDIVSILITDEQRKPQIKHIVDAL